MAVVSVAVEEIAADGRGADSVGERKGGALAAAVARRKVVETPLACFGRIDAVVVRQQDERPVGRGVEGGGEGAVPFSPGYGLREGDGG